MANSDYSAFKKEFWDQVIMKIVRGLASVKYQWLILLYAPTIWGMLHNNPATNSPWITATEGLTFLAGGFVTLCGSRILANTSFTNTDDSGINTDK